MIEYFKYLKENCRLPRVFVVDDDHFVIFDDFRNVRLRKKADLIFANLPCWVLEQH